MNNPNPIYFDVSCQGIVPVAIHAFSSRGALQRGQRRRGAHSSATVCAKRKPIYRHDRRAPLIIIGKSPALMGDS